MKRSFYTLMVIAFALISEMAIAQQTRRTVGNTRTRLAIEQQAQLQGTILIADAGILQQLQQGWQTNLSQAPGNKIKVELWQVNYTPDRQNNNNTDIILTQKIDANVSYQLVQGGVQYSINYRPASGRLAVIAYTYVAPNETVKFTGKPNDGTPANMTHQFKSNARQYLGNNIIYGIYSFPGPTNNIDFQLKSSIQANCNNCDLLGDAWNTVTDVANDAANFAKATVLGTGEAVKDLGESIVEDGGTFAVQGFGVVATVLQTGNLSPQARLLSDTHYGAAYNIANSTIFMNTLPPANKIIVTNLMSINNRQFTLPIKTGNDVFILMNMGKGFDDPLNFPGNGFAGDVFIHELTHAWQIAQVWHSDALLKLYADGAENQIKNSLFSNQYQYSCDDHNLTESYNEEQQAMIVQHFYTALFYSQRWCGFEQQWVVQNILGNQPANIDARFTVTKQIMAAATDRTTAVSTGGVIDHSIAFASNGNRMDGTGYYLPGKTNNSFFYYSNKTKTISANWGPIRDKYIKAGYEFGELGWPEMNETLLPDKVGFFQRLNHGFIYWHPKYGAYVVLNKIFDAWKDTGWETGKLGYPVSDYISETITNNNQLSEYRDKGYQKFAGGVIFYALPKIVTASLVTGNHNYTTIEYGDPDRIIALHRSASTVVTHDKEQINPQPLPPRGARSALGSTSEAAKVQINPQPLPPKTVKSGIAENAQAAKVQINPQPLPPKTVKRATATIHQPKAEINPQPLPPKN